MIIDLLILEGASFDGEKLLFGQKIDVVPRCLGTPDQMENAYYFLDNTVSIHVDQDGCIEFIEVSTDDPLTICCDGQNLSELPQEALLDFLREKNKNEIQVEENRHSFTFVHISTGLYYDITPEDVEEIIRESKADGVYGEMKEEIQADIERAKRPSAIGIGKAQYYTNKE